MGLARLGHAYKAGTLSSGSEVLTFLSIGISNATLGILMDSGISAAIVDLEQWGGQL
jgi:hypothetical protein